MCQILTTFEMSYITTGLILSADNNPELKTKGGPDLSPTALGKVKELTTAFLLRAEDCFHPMDDPTEIDEAFFGSTFYLAHNGTGLDFNSYRNIFGEYAGPKLTELAMEFTPIEFVLGPDGQVEVQA